MASSLALKKLLASNLLTKSPDVRPLAAAASRYAASRLFNSNAVREFSDDEDRALDDDRRRDSSVRRVFPFSGVFDPLSPTRSVSQILNLMDLLESSPMSGGFGGGVRHGWEAKETEDGLHFRVDMPGLGKEDVRVSVEQNTLLIKGEGGKESAEDDDDDGSVRRYSRRIDLPEKLYKLDAIKAEMKNGVLKVVVPKVKEDERTDVLHVKIE